MNKSQHNPDSIPVPLCRLIDYLNDKKASKDWKWMEDVIQSKLPKKVDDVKKEKEEARKAAEAAKQKKVEEDAKKKAEEAAKKKAEEAAKKKAEEDAKNAEEAKKSKKTDQKSPTLVEEYIRGPVYGRDILNLANETV